MTQVTVGPQLGGQAYSRVIFFQDKRAGGAGAGASGTPSHATAASQYHGGMAIFTIAKGGLMYEASVGGQKFSYRPK